MRRITQLDLEVERAWLDAMPVSLRGYMRGILRNRAMCADKYRKRFRRAHPKWGIGTLWSILDKLKH